jgi:hypothetical protein
MYVQFSQVFGLSLQDIEQIGVVLHLSLIYSEIFFLAVNLYARSASLFAQITIDFLCDPRQHML